MVTPQDAEKKVVMPKGRLLEIDFMRFSAAMGVVLYHYTSHKPFVDGIRVPVFPLWEPVTRYGYLGVDLFFMISGFVIILSSMNRTPFEFVVSRVSRLYPGYWAAIFFTVAVVAILGNRSSRISFPELMMNLTMVNDYFNIKDVDGVYWTLHVELKFYFLIFVLILLRQIKNIEKWLVFWVVVVSVYCLNGNPSFLGWFISPSYSSYFIAGATFYLILTKGVSPCRIALLVVSYILSLLNALQRIEGFVHAEVMWFDQIVTFFAITSFFVLFGAVSLGKTAFLKKKYFVPLGALTYPLYLIHNVAGKVVFGSFVPHVGKNIAFLFTLLFAVGGAWTIYCLVERKGAVFLREKLFWFRNVFVK